MMTLLDTDGQRVAAAVHLNPRRFLERSGLPVGQQQPDFPHIGFVYDLALPQGAFPLCALLGQDVAVM
jgi:hypothetical protein